MEDGKKKLIELNVIEWGTFSIPKGVRFPHDNQT
jgi:hypothetical protein